MSIYKYINIISLITFSFLFSQDVTLSLDGSNLNYESSEDIAGFQFSHNGCVIGASGGDAEANGFTITSSGSTVLGFSFTGSVVPAGAGTLVELEGDVTADCLSDFIISNSSGQALDVVFDSGSADDGGDTGGDDGGGSWDGDACSMPDDNIHVTAGGSVLYNSSSDIGGFQFNVDGATVNGAGGGDAEANGFMISSSATTVLGFSLTGGTIPTGCGTLVELDLDGEATGLSGIVMSDPTGNALAFEYFDATVAGPSLSITSPADGSTLTSYDVELEFSVSDFDVASDDGDGHIHYSVDGGGTVMVYSTDSITLNLDNGSHTIEAWLVDNSHMPFDPAVSASTTFAVDVALVSGCTDSAACNYNPEAEDDDGSCEYVEDCAGECGGDAVEDCAGECGGSAVEDCAGECGGDAVEDCADECGGSAEVDACGVCDGGATDPNDCVQEGYSLSLANVSASAGTLNIVMNNEGPVAGFQFNLSGVTITGASGGSAEANGFMISTSATTILGFSLTGSTIDPGNGTLVQVTFDGSPDLVCITDAILSDPSGNALDATTGDCYELTSGCTDESACNYNPDALEDDGSCAYEVDCAGDCGGSAVEDCAGE